MRRMGFLQGRLHFIRQKKVDAISTHEHPLRANFADRG
jgi:hypothetical protein